MAREEAQDGFSYAGGLVSIGGFHLGDRVVERVADEAREWTVAGPIHSVPKPLEQRERQRDRDPLFPRP